MLLSRQALSDVIMREQRAREMSDVELGYLVGVEPRDISGIRCGRRRTYEKMLLVLDRLGLEVAVEIRKKTTTSRRSSSPTLRSCVSASA